MSAPAAKDCNCLDCQAMRKAQNTSVPKKSTACDCKDCQAVLKAQRNGTLQLQLTGAVAHAICEKLATGKINVWELLPLKPQQRQKGAPQLVYLAGMTFIASAHQNKPPFTQGQIDFFTELQKLYNSKRETPLANPTIYLLSELFVPCKEAQDIIDRQVMSNQYQLDAKNLITVPTTTSLVVESLLQEEPTTGSSSSTNNKKKRGKKKKGKKKRGANNSDCGPNAKANGETTMGAMNTENNEWLEKLQHVLRTTADGDDEPMDLPMLCQEVNNSESDAATTLANSNKQAPEAAPCSIVASPSQQETEEEGSSSLMGMNVHQVMAFMKMNNNEVTLEEAKAVAERATIPRHIPILKEELDELGIPDDVPVMSSSDSDNIGDETKAAVPDEQGDDETTNKGVSESNGEKDEQDVPVSTNETSIQQPESPSKQNDSPAAAEAAEQITSLEEKVRKLQQALEEKDFLLEVQEEMLLEKNTEIDKQQAALNEKDSLLVEQQEANKALRLKLEASESRNHAFQEAFQQHAQAIASIGQDAPGNDSLS